ncbi:recombinase family protein [Oerskovia sp. KBS0722]|uniref:recombinase family protein n=1 Tax=Oerskovia sp. KBS0722 TaxID=1179673 RepID=UPI00143D86B0|nr:recombinase family protein [Oerskovia sp. KBS0722]
MAHTYGYARVSTIAQNLNAQIDALTGPGGVDERDVFVEKASGTREDRPELARLLAGLREGDALVVTKLDRLGRSAAHVARLVRDLDERAVTLRSLSETLDTSSAAGRLMAQEGLRTLALSLLVGAPYSTDGVPTALVAAAWSASRGFERRTRAMGSLVVDLVESGQASLLEVRYTSERATTASTRPLPIDELERDPARLFPAVVADAVSPSSAGWIPHLFAEAPLDELLWPDAFIGASGAEDRTRLADGLGRLHTLCVAASGTGGPRADLDGRLPALLGLLSRSRFAGAEPPRPAVSAVMLVLSAVAGAEGAHAVREVAGVLAAVREAAGWVLPAAPWRAPGDLFADDAWLTLA